MDDFIITNKISKSDFKDLQIKLNYSNWWVMSMVIISVLFLICAIFLYLFNRSYLFNSDLCLFGMIILMISVLHALFVYLFSTYFYKRNQRISELITYHFSEMGVKTKGESFTTEFTWQKLHKVKLIKGWLLLYQTNLVANAIKISEEDLAKVYQIRQFLTLSNSGLKVKIT